MFQFTEGISSQDIKVDLHTIAKYIISYDSVNFVLKQISFGFDVVSTKQKLKKQNKNTDE